MVEVLPAPSIRPARPSDVDAIAAVQRASILGLAADAYGAERAAAWADASVRHAPTLLDDGAFFVAEDAARVVGVAGWSPHDRPGTARLRAVFVHPDAARRGLGRRLVTAVEASARGAGYGAFAVLSSVNAVGFYEALGYAEVERLVWPPEPPGRGLPCVLMAKGAADR